MMAEKSKRSKKKSKDYDDSSDEDIEAYVNQQIKGAMKEVNKAMKQAKIATKAGKTAQHFQSEAATGEPTGKGKKTGSSTGKGDTYKHYTTVNHRGTMINIQNAQHVMVGNNNMMLVGSNVLSSKRRSSRSSDTSEEDRQKEEEDKRRAVYYSDTYKHYTTVNHRGTMINIQNAQHVMVGNNNMMLVGSNVLSSKRRSSRSSDTSEEDRQKEEEDKRRAAEAERIYKDLLECSRLATRDDFKLTCPHITSWRRFLRNLELSDGEIEQLHIEHDGFGICEVLIQGSILWTRKGGREATLGAFANILLKLYQFDSLERLKV